MATKINHPGNSREYKKEWMRRWRLNNPKLNKEKAKKYRKQKNTYNRRYRVEQRELVWAYRIKREHGITSDQYYVLLAEQGGLCFICRQPETRMIRGRITKFDIDHDHKTGKVRKLLCHACNVSIGLLQENPDRMRRAAEYIELFLPKREEE